MTFLAINKPDSRRHPAPARSAALDLRTATSLEQQDSHNPPAQETSEHEASDQTKLDHAWTQRLANASQLSHNFANIAVQAHGEQVPAPIQPELAPQPYTAGVQAQFSQPAPAYGPGGGMNVVQGRFVIEQPRIQQESVADALTQVVQPPGEALQRYPTIDDGGREDAVIYVIYKNNGKTDGSNVLYVGQTTAKREFQRFQEHASNDAWAPWYIHATATGLDYTVDRAKWPYDYRVIENLKDVTKFETTVAEQWWLEYYLKKGMTLLNDSTPCTIENFNKRSGIAALYDPTRIGVDKSYKPSLKAK